MTLTNEFGDERPANGAARSDEDIDGISPG